MRKVLSALLMGALLLAAPGLAFADTGAGTAKGVAPDAAAVAKGATRTLVVGSDVFIGDVINTGPKGDVQILFADNTQLVVGPHSSLKIEDYLLRNNGDPGKFTVDMLSGAFRFATGNSPKSDYQIKTPDGTIGVRGTRFDVFVGGGHTRLMMYEGTTRFCARNGQCVNLSGVCNVGDYTTALAQIVGDARNIGGAEHTALRSQFIYFVNQSPLLRAFWFPNGLECLNRTPVITVTDPGITNNHGQPGPQTNGNNGNNNPPPNNPPANPPGNIVGIRNNNR